MLQKIKGKEHIIEAAGNHGIGCLCKALLHIQPLGPRKLCQSGIVLDAEPLNGKFL